MCPPCTPLSGWIPRLLPAPAQQGNIQGYAKGMFPCKQQSNLMPSLLFFSTLIQNVFCFCWLSCHRLPGPDFGGQQWELREEEGRNREEVGGCDGSDYFEPRMPFSEGYGPKSRGRICPLWTYHPKSLGCTSPLMLLAQ